ncbi:MAG: hypothetical protein COB15_16400 [Flavobacteriales bacterium]|nr:MAG: hypothetical protein COB15_16400 [Flavobacteriales bacterium]
MKKYFFIFSTIALILFSCSKEEGEGGRSSISGTIHMTDNTGNITGEYNAPDYDVYIIYGDKDDVYDDDMKTNFDGTFQFKNLREGSYRIYTYTKADPTITTPNVSPVFKALDIGKNEDGNVGTIEVTK